MRRGGAMVSTRLIDIVSDWLKSHGYDGLCYIYGWDGPGSACSCIGNGLMASCAPQSCVAGYWRTCAECPEGCAYQGDDPEFVPGCVMPTKLGREHE